MKQPFDNFTRAFVALFVIFFGVATINAVTTANAALGQTAKPEIDIDTVLCDTILCYDEPSVNAERPVRMKADSVERLKYSADALKYYAGRGIPRFRNALAQCMILGARGIDKDVDGGVKMLQQMALEGDMEAYEALVACYQRGFAKFEDPGDAEKLFYSYGRDVMDGIVRSKVHDEWSFLPEVKELVSALGTEDILSVDTGEPLLRDGSQYGTIMYLSTLDIDKLLDEAIQDAGGNAINRDSLAAEFSKGINFIRSTVYFIGKGLKSPRNNRAMAIAIGEMAESLSEPSQDLFDAELRYYVKAADGGDAFSAYKAGTMMCDNSATTDEGISYITRSAEAGYAPAQYALGMKYHNGDGVTANQDIADKWIKNAADGGYAPAQWDYGTSLLEKQPDKRSYSHALEYLAQARAKGYGSQLQELMALVDKTKKDAFNKYVAGMKCYVDGDLEKAMRLMKEVEKTGSPDGKIMQCVILADSRYAKNNKEKARKNLGKLAVSSYDAALVRDRIDRNEAALHISDAVIAMLRDY